MLRFLRSLLGRRPLVSPPAAPARPIHSHEPPRAREPELPWHRPASQAPAPPTPDQSFLARASGRFAVDLYRELAEKPGNLCFSPSSVFWALLMAYAGARGATAEAMAKGMRLRTEGGPDPPEADRLLAAAGSILADAVQSDSGTELNIANSLWIQKGWGVAPAFVEALHTLVAACVEEVEFAGDPEEARRRINVWVEGETREKIKDLVPPGYVTNLTRLVLANAVYFKGWWEGPFSPSLTQEADFRLTRDRSAKVPMMRRTAWFGYRAEPGMQVLEMPYVGRSFSMIVLLPDEVEGLPGLEERLSPSWLESRLGTLPRREVRVCFPRFRILSPFFLREVLCTLGFSLAFDLERADFSGIGGGREPLALSEAVHKAFVAVDEEGTEAVAATALTATAMGLGPPPEPIEFRADHPFLFLIRHLPSGTLLFLGRVADLRPLSS